MNITDEEVEAALKTWFKVEVLDWVNEDERKDAYADMRAALSAARNIKQATVADMGG